MKNVILILIVVCFISLIGCSEDKKPTMTIENVNSISNIENLDHVYISKMSFTGDWIVWIHIESKGNKLMAEGENKILQIAFSEAIEKAERYGKCLE